MNRLMPWERQCSEFFYAVSFQLAKRVLSSHSAVRIRSDPFCCYMTCTSYIQLFMVRYSIDSRVAQSLAFKTWRCGCSNRLYTPLYRVYFEIVQKTATSIDNGWYSMWDNALEELDLDMFLDLYVINHKRGWLMGVLVIDRERLWRSRRAAWMGIKSSCIA